MIAYLFPILKSAEVQPIGTGSLTVSGIELNWVQLVSQVIVA